MCVHLSVYLCSYLLLCSSLHKSHLHRNNKELPEKSWGSKEDEDKKKYLPVGYTERMGVHGNEMGQCL